MTSKHHTDQRIYFIRALQISGLLLLGVLCGLSQAQGPTIITSDGTLNTTVTQNGNLFNIEDGTIRGSNQFHSFGRFSVGAGDIASFNGPGGIENILSRVTGGLGSDINGTLRSTINGANLFLLNPAGVIFGPNASLDISGSFHVGTADFLRLGDDGIFYADPLKNSLLTMAPPSAFGFLGKNPAGITIEQSELKVPEGQTLSVVGGDFNIRSGNLSAQRGRINLVSVGSPGEVHVDDPGLNVDAFNELGEVNLAEATVESQTVVIRGGRLEVVQGGVQAAGAQAKIDIAVRGEAVLSQSAAIVAEAKPAGQTEGSVPEADDGDMADTSHITLSARDDIQVAPEARVSASGSQGGTIHLASETGTTWVAGTVEAAGTATTGGEVHILGEQVGLAAGASVDVSGATRGGTALVGGDFQGGNPDIKNATVTYMDPGATITADARSNGDGGTAVVWADHTARVHGTITARGGDQGGDGGLIETSGKRHLDVAVIKVDAGAPQGAPGTWQLDPLDVEITENPTRNVDEDPSGVFTPNDDGVSTISNTDIETGLNAGTSVTISTVGTLESANPPDQKGDITVAASIQKTGDEIATLTLEAANDIIMDGETIDGSGLNVVFDAASRVAIINTAQINTSSIAGSDVAAGDLTVKATTIELQQSTIDAGTFGTGDAGIVTLNATEAITIAGSTIFSDATDTASGNAGGITVTAPQVTLSESQLRSNVDVGEVMGTGTGEGGLIEIVAREAIHLTDSTLTVTVADVPQDVPQEDAGLSGEIELTTPALTMIGGDVAAATRGERDAGFITIEATTVELRSDSTIDTGTFGAGNAGDVTITATKGVTITDDSVIFSDANEGSTGDAGNVEITAPTVSLTKGGSIVNKTDVGSSGQGGNITIIVEELTLGEQDNEGTETAIDSSTFGAGNAGKVTITATKGVTITGSSTIFSDADREDTGPVSTGNAGDVEITAPTVSLTEGGSIVNKTCEGCTGQGGFITIDASEEIRLENATVSATVDDVPQDVPQEGPGFSGDIILTTPALTMIGGRVAAETTGTRDAGSILLNVGTLNVSTPAGQEQAQINSSSTETATGNAGFVEIRGEASTDQNPTMADTVTLNNSVVTTAAAGTGQGGFITIDASEEIRLENATLSSTVAGGLDGFSGDIFLTTPTLTMEGGSIEAQSTGTRAAGNIDLQVDNLTTQKGTESIVLPNGETTGVLISSESTATGEGGIITIDASKEIRLENTTVSATVTDGIEGERGDIELTTPALTMIGGRVAAETRGEREGGIIALEVGSLNMSTPAGQQQAQISSRSSGAATGIAGEVIIRGVGGANTKSDTVLLTNSAVTTEAVVADGGNITILADSMVRLLDGKITTAVRSGEGGGGNIKIDPEFVILESFSQIIANAFGGPGGNINITADAFLADAEKSIVSASSVLGVDGEINIDAITDLSGAITPLEKRFSEAATLLRQRCAERLRGGQISSFIVGGRDGVPLEPGELLPSPLYMMEEPVVPGRGDRQEHTPDESAGFIGFDEQGQPHIRGWPLPGFSQAWLNLECAEWLME